jgi:DNA methylase/Putative Ig domain
MIAKETTLADQQRIELLWPAKGRSVEQNGDGEWLLVAEGSNAGLCPLLPDGDVADSEPDHIAISGDRLSALRTLRHSCSRQVRLVYADLPRLQGFDESRAFQAEDGIEWNTWLSSLREHFRYVYPLLAEDGVLVVQAGDLEESYAKVLLFEIFGHNNYIGTIVWQSHYSPKGGKATSELAAIHENLICFAYSRSHIERLALPVAPKDYKNPDGDPRGDWQAKQKDAGRDTVKLTYNVPPYRWCLVDSVLPSGLWRLSPMSGVIWGTPTEVGAFPLTIEVTDSEGGTATATITLDVLSNGVAESASDVWWRANPPAPGGNLRINADIPAAVLGQPYSAVLAATGGTPFTGTPRPSRGWGFGEKTLIKAILEDRMYFGRNGMAIPETKKYLAALEDGVSYTNVASWWPGEDGGWTQDATKGLNSLLEQGIIERTNPTSKPKQLLTRLIEIFTRPDDLVVELFARSGDLMSTAVTTNRRSIALFGSSRDDASLLSQCAIPRVRYELNTVGRSGLRHYRLGGPLLMPPPAPGASVSITSAYLDDTESLLVAILTSQGFFERTKSEAAMQGQTADRHQCALVLPPDRFLQQEEVDEFVSIAVASGKKPTIFYFRAAPDFPTVSSRAGLTLRRVPMDLSI